MNTPPRPRVSVCVPVYNGARYLSACLDSALSQTMDDIEVVVVDDRSSDDTVPIAEAYARQDPRVRIELNDRRLGLIPNWNRCVELASGEWVKFLFQDDLLARSCVETLLSVGDEREAPIVACRRDIEFEDVSIETREEYLTHLAEESFGAVFGERTTVGPEDFCEGVLAEFGINFVGEPTAVLLHRSLFRRFGMFNPSFTMIGDIEYWIRVGIHVGMRFVPEALATFRAHAGSATATSKWEVPHRVEWFDPAILLHEVVFNPLYAPLRAAASRRSPPVDLKRRFAWAALRARESAEGDGATSGPEKERRLADWRTAVAEYPRLARSFPIRALKVRVALYRARQRMLARA